MLLLSKPEVADDALFVLEAVTQAAYEALQVSPPADPSPSSEQISPEASVTPPASVAEDTAAATTASSPQQSETAEVIAVNADTVGSPPKAATPRDTADDEVQGSLAQEPVPPPSDNSVESTELPTAVSDAVAPSTPTSITTTATSTTPTISSSPRDLPTNVQQQRAPSVMSVESSEDGVMVDAEPRDPTPLVLATTPRMQEPQITPREEEKTPPTSAKQPVTVVEEVIHLPRPSVVAQSLHDRNLLGMLSLLAHYCRVSLQESAGARAMVLSERGTVLYCCNVFHLM